MREETAWPFAHEGRPRPLPDEESSPLVKAALRLARANAVLVSIEAKGEVAVRVPFARRARTPCSSRSKRRVRSRRDSLPPATLETLRASHNTTRRPSLLVCRRRGSSFVDRRAVSLVEGIDGLFAQLAPAAARAIVRMRADLPHAAPPRVVVVVSVGVHYNAHHGRGRVSTDAFDESSGAAAAATRHLVGHFDFYARTAAIATATAAAAGGGSGGGEAPPPPPPSPPSHAALRRRRDDTRVRFAALEVTPQHWATRYGMWDNSVADGGGRPCRALALANASAYVAEPGGAGGAARPPHDESGQRVESRDAALLKANWR